MSDCCADDNASVLDYDLAEITASGNHPVQGDDLARQMRFVRRIHWMRTLGLALGFVCVASVLQLHHAPIAWWIALAVNAFAWPHVAWLLAERRAHPTRAEIRNLMIDSALGGVWIAVMQFNLLPSVVLATMLSVDKVGVGGMRLLAKTSMLLIAACAATSALLGFPVQIATPMDVMLACLPLLIVYPLAIGNATYSLAKRLARQNRRLDELGRTDALTGLANRRQCLALVESELARHRRNGRPAVLVILDIDHFKSINDRYGHPIGDEVLCKVAKVLLESSRKSDSVARYGGDEFVMMLPETTLRGAEEASRRIRTKLEGGAFERAPDLHCTVSLGAAEASAQMDVDAWVRQADDALYRAKLAGRNRFEAAAPAGTDR
ncbi:MAG: diguanylate cyclase [Betaproteobacteria bacterium]